jgi:hypothetical protein
MHITFELTDEQRAEIAREWLRGQTIYASDPNVYYEPFCEDGRVGYRCQTNNAGDCRETYVYFNPSTSDTNDTPNVFVYQGGDNDPSVDGAECYIALEELRDGELCKCGHNLHQHEADGSGGVCAQDCHGCKAGEEAHAWAD